MKVRDRSKWIMLLVLTALGAWHVDQASAQQNRRDQGNAAQDQADQDQYDDRQDANRRAQGDDRDEGYYDDQNYSDQNYDDQDYDNQRNREQDAGNQSRSRQDRSRREGESYRDDRTSRQNDNNDPSAALGIRIDEGRQGVRVTGVARRSPADQAGIRPGDEIVAVNGRRIDGVRQLVQYIDQESPGNRVELQIVRNGQRQTLTPRLESRREAFGAADGQAGRQGRSGDNRRQGAPAPWGSDELMQHVDALEREVDDLRREIRDLRAMLDNDPAGASFDGNRRERGARVRRGQTDQDEGSRQDGTRSERRQARDGGEYPAR